MLVLNKNSIENKRLNYLAPIITEQGMWPLIAADNILSQKTHLWIALNGV